MDAEDGLVELADAIAIVRDQLIAAQLAGHGTVGRRALGFLVGKVTIEFSGEVKRTGGAGGEAKFWVFTANAKADLSSGSTQKIVVELLPQNSFAVADAVEELPDS